MNSKLLPNIWCGMVHWTGHFISVLMRWDALSFLYPVYNWLMCKSSDINDKYGLDYWSEPINHEES